MAYVNPSNEKHDHSHCEQYKDDINIKNCNFSVKNDQQIRQTATQQTILKSLGRIGIGLNEKHTESIPTKDLKKVCFILINTRPDDNSELGFGSLNDGYLVGLKHHRHEFKIFYLYNPRSDEFSTFLCFFLKYTKDALTVFYSGRGSNDKEGIEFKDETLSKSSINKFILEECEGKKQVLFITDCVDGGLVFDINGINNDLNLVSFSVAKINNSDENERPHGIFTYYFCKLTNDFPNITSSRLVERMNPSLHLFNQDFTVQASKNELFESPIFS